ncbi:high-temperature-induced dauer-formation protein-domain-containing protein [Cokeromyces recurvatus]|uniref:high-temperature-induced dauer-formation protein-domain-containing protein n=1 Tax=Cokeromyces recurvatus TaxID=90255 RepID=UPI002220521D|nr:high-temperature-induced dauer-formation protein-domain-containing protein [Cokeromyces recurvatus]KAI7907919.1 high-temperature-induced dauer-formation protein-domain-containing protein [Cokeromyces recurvatus]
MGATDSKLAFRKSVFRLFEERNVSSFADDYWSLFWTLPETVDDVYTLVSPTDIRKTRDGARENLETLIDKVMEQMTILIDSTNNFQPIQFLNCFRILTRIMPFLFESADCNEWEDVFFWKPRLQVKEESNNTMLPPRGEVLIKLTLQALFMAGFTLPQSMGTAENRVNYVIWETGVGSSTPIGSSRDNDMNRIEILRFLIVLFSKSMYQSPTHVLTKTDPWLNYMIRPNRLERKVVLAFLCSMLNTACKFNPMGWTTAVPYNHIVFTDSREQLVALCLRALLILLDYNDQSTLVSALQNQLNSSSNSSSSSSSNNTRNDIVAKMDAISIEETNNHKKDMDNNIFIYYLSKLHRAQDFQFLIDGIYRILSSPMQSLNSYLPGSSKRVRYHVEMMMLCWKLLEINNRFTNYLMETERALDLMVVLVFYASENKLDLSQIGLVRMCSFTLQMLSSNRTFSVKLNKSFDGHASLPINIRIPNFQGTYADYLILSIFSLIASSKGTLSTLYPALIKTITNISPYLKGLSRLTCSKLLTLFGSISAPGFILADEANYHLVEYLLETINNIIQFQYTNNPNLIFMILRYHQKFEKIAEFSLDNAIIEMERIRHLKETRLQQRESGGENGMSEKARGKLPEGSSLSRVSSNSSMQFQRQQSSSSLSSMNSSGNLVLPGTKNGFIPTEDWVYHWHSKLPLDTTAILIHTLLPKLNNNLSNEQEVFNLIHITSTDGLLPTTAHPVIIRKFQWTEPLVIWFRSMLWGQTYISSVSNYGPWNHTQVKLFHIKQQQQTTDINNVNPSPINTPLPPSSSSSS